MNVMKLIAEVKQFPYLYDRTLPEYGDKDLQSRTWDIITANIYADQWNKFSYAEKAKKGNILREQSASSLFPTNSCFSKKSAK